VKKVLSGIGNTALTQVILRSVQLVVNALLARILSPADYGVVAFANIVIELLYHMNSLGLQTALIQVEPLRQETKNTSATLAVLLAIGAFVVAQACAPLAGILLESPESVDVVRVLAFTFLLNPLGFLPVALLTRDMRFGRLRNAQVAGTIVRAAVSVTLAFNGWKYWSLVIGHLAGLVCTSLMLALQNPMRWSVQLDRGEARRLLTIGVPLTLAALVTFGLMKADSFLIGTMLGQDHLGYYAIALLWATVTSTLMAEVVHLVLLPHFARLQSNPDALRAQLKRVLVPIGVFASVAAMSLFAVTDWFLMDILGNGTDRWLPAGQVMRILCVYCVLRAITETLDSPILAMGDTKLLLKSNLLAAVIAIALLPLAISWWGLLGAGMVTTIAYATQWAVFLPYLHRRLGLRFGEVTRALAPIVVAGAASVALASLVPTEGGPGSRVLLAVARVAIVCVSLVAIHELLTRGRLWTEAKAVLRALRSPETAA
jgi:PST family polysaccharide transporter